MAARVAAELKRYMGLDSRSVDVGMGHFNVLVDGEKLFSKMKEGRFPQPGEIVKRLRSKG